MDLNLSQAIANGAFDDLYSTPNSLFIRNARWFQELIDQCLLLGIRLGTLARLPGRFLCLGERQFFPKLARIRQQIVELAGHGSIPVLSCSSTGSRRLGSRIEDGRKIWKLSDMDLKSYTRWYDYSRARDEMFRNTDKPWAPWYMARSDDKKRARLNIITHLLSQIPYKEIPRAKVELPKRKKDEDYVEPDYQLKLIPELF